MYSNNYKILPWFGSNDLIFLRLQLPKHVKGSINETQFSLQQKQDIYDLKHEQCQCFHSHSTHNYYAHPNHVRYSNYIFFSDVGNASVKHFPQLQLWWEQIVTHSPLLVWIRTQLEMVIKKGERVWRKSKIVNVAFIIITVARHARQYCHRPVRRLRIVFFSYCFFCFIRPELYTVYGLNWKR